MSPPNIKTQRTFSVIVANFLRSLKAQNRSERTLGYYREKLAKIIAAYPNMGCEDLSAPDLREFLISLQATNSPGGVHGHFRAMRALWYWYENEYSPPGWTNPMRRVKAPNVPDEILPPVTSEQLEGMIRNCDRSTWHGVRDRAIIMVLNGTGLRASELAALELGDLDLVISTLMVRSGKGGYPRALDFDKPTKAALRAYIGRRDIHEDRDTETLFISDEGNPLTPDTLRRILQARAVGYGHVSAHMFRRKHALDLYRRGYSRDFIANRLGHHGTAVVDRYIKLSPQEMIERSMVNR